MAYESNDGIFLRKRLQKCSQNVTANRRIFFEFSNKDPEKAPSKMKWILEGYFCVYQCNNPPKNVRIYERYSESFQIYFQKGVSFCFQNVRIDRESFLQSERRWWKSKRKSPSWPIPSTAGQKSWSTCAATMKEGIASLLTMEKNACACKAFPTPCCATGSVLLSYHWMNLWQQLCFTGKSRNGVLYAGNPFFPVPTGPNTAGPAPPSSTAGRKL